MIILYATDLEPESSFRCRYVLDLAAKLEADVHVLHVVESVVGVPNTDDTAALLEAEKAIRESLHGMSHSSRVRSFNAVAGITVAIISAELQRVEADMLAVGASHRGALGRLLHGSVTTPLLRRTKIPVLVIPSDVVDGSRT